MSLTNDELKRVAGLARLHVEESEMEGFRAKISAVLEYVAKLEELNTDGIPEIMNGAGELNAFREDEPEPSLPSDRAQLIAAFPRRQGDLLEVPAVFESRNE